MTEYARPGADEDLPDSLREQLLDAASRVFASKGFSGTKVGDIVRAAGLSAGAIYGRFESKKDLLIAAVVRATLTNAQAQRPEEERVADLLMRRVSASRGPLTDEEALQLEALVAARREPEVAEAVSEARRIWRESIEPLVRDALEDGTIAPGIDVESVVYFIHTVGLGVLLQRGAGIDPPAPDQWLPFIERVLRSMGSGVATPANSTTPAGPRRARGISARPSRRRRH